MSELYGIKISDLEGVASVSPDDIVPILRANGSSYLNKTATLGEIVGLNRNFIHIFDYIPSTRHSGLLARTDSDTIHVELQAAIDEAATIGGGTIVLPAMHAKISSKILIKDNNIFLLGQGSSYTRQGIAAIRDAAATRLYWDVNAATPASGTPMIHFQTPSGVPAKSGGGIKGLMLDGMAVNPVGIKIETWRTGLFEDVYVYANTEDQWLSAVVDYALSSGPADVQRCLFVNCFASTFGGSGWFLTNEARGWRLTGGSSVNTGNTSFNTFINCTAYMSKGTAWTIENTDNNYFYNCAGSAAFGATSGYGLILCSADEDSSNNSNPAHARYNFFIGGQWSALCKAAQSGESSSADNVFLGLSRANGNDLPVLETGAGGSANATALVISNDEIYTNSIQSAELNAELLVGPQGTGALRGSNSGASRGLYSTDWQRARTNSSKVAAGAYSVVAGGSDNLASGSYTVVGGGVNNTASQTHSVVGGGNTNAASGDFATVGGGRRNTAQGDYSWVPGGAYADSRGIRRGVWASFNLGSEYGSAQATETVLCAQTTDTTATRATTDGELPSSLNTLNLIDNSTSGFNKLLIVARQIGGSSGSEGDSASWEISTLLKRISGTTLQGGGSGIAPELSDAGAATWTVDVTVDATNHGVAVTVNGEANKTINWVVRAVGVEVMG